MTEFQRSVTSFRRQGSSGLVWDDKLIAAIENQNQQQQQQSGAEAEGEGSSATLQRSRSAGSRPYRTVNVTPQAVDPPSPKLATCGFCALFRKPVVSAKTKTATKSKRRTR